MTDPTPPEDGAEGEDAAQAPPRPPLPLDQLQAAGRELIGAMRALLDVADDLLSDPRTADAVESALSSLERAASRAAVTGRRAATNWSAGASAPDDDEGDDDEDPGPGVQRIPVS